MKKLFTILLLVSGTFRIANAQTPDWLWAVHSGGGSYQYPNGLWVDQTDTLYMAGRLSGTISFNGGVSASGTGADNPFVGKLDPNGKSVWLKAISFSGGYDYGWGFCIDNKSNVYTAGVVSSGASMFVMKYDKFGNLKWSITPSGGGIGGMGLVTDGADNLYVVGSIQGNVTLGSTTLTYTGSGQNIFLAKLDTNGHFLWAVSSGVSGGSGGYDVARSVTIDQYANVYVAGGYGGTPTFGSFTAPAAAGGTSNLFIAEYDSSGNALNLITAANAGIDNGDCCTLNHITLDSCRNIYITGYYRNTSQFGNFSVTSQGGQDIFVAKATNSGVWQWANDIGSSDYDQPGGITFDKNSDIYVGGVCNNSSVMFGSTPVTVGRYFVAKYANSNGALQWVQTAGSQANGGGIGGIAVDNQKYVYVTGNGGNGAQLTFGSISISPSSNSDIFVAKLDTVPPRTILPVVSPAYCPGSSTILPYTINGTFNNGNVFTAQLSDSTGSFASPVTLGDTTTANGGNINITIPVNTPSGSNYLIRVVSSNPATSSYVNGCGAYYANNVYVNTLPITIGGAGVTARASNDTSVCYGSFVQLHASGGSTYSWSPGSTLNDSTSANPYAAPTSPQIYTVTVSSGSCGSGTAMVKVNVNPLANISVSPADTSVCSGVGVTLHAGGAITYQWTPGSTLSDSTIANPVATLNSSVTYSVTGNGGVCSNTMTVTVNVGNTAVGGIITAVRDTICQGTPGNLTLAGNSSSTIDWQLSTDDINFTDAGGTATTYKTTPLQQTTWYRTIVGSGNCTASSDTFELYVPPALVATFYITQTSSTQVSFNSDSSVGNIRSYHWDFGDGSTSTEQNPTHTYAKDTTYYVCLTLYDGSNCSYTFCRYNTLEGVPTIAAGGNWIVYPDPFTSQLVISAKQNSAQIQSIEMYDVLGRLVINQNLDNVTNASLQLDVSSLAKGMYYVMIRTANADYVQKVVKQ